MPNKIFNIRLRNKRDTEANWEKKNPLILDGEIIVVTTTSGETRVKIGDGTKTYTQLPFLDEVLKNESKSLGLTSATVPQLQKKVSVMQMPQPLHVKDITPFLKPKLLQVILFLAGILMKFVLH